MIPNWSSLQPVKNNDLENYSVKWGKLKAVLLSENSLKNMEWPILEEEGKIHVIRKKKKD